MMVVLADLLCFCIIIWHISHSTSLAFKDGKYREALGKWEAALTLMPENAVLHEQKAQILLEVADAWNALKAATSMPSFLFFWNNTSLLLLLTCDGSVYGNLFLEHL